MTLMYRARKGEITPEIARAARTKTRSREAPRADRRGESGDLQEQKRRDIRPVPVGEGLTVKVNANFGSSRDHADIAARAREDARRRRGGRRRGDGPVHGRADRRDPAGGPGRVPTFPSGPSPSTRRRPTATCAGKSWVELTADDFFAGIEKQAEDGVDFMTVHCGVTRATIERAASGKGAASTSSAAAARSWPSGWNTTGRKTRSTNSTTGSSRSAGSTTSRSPWATASGPDAWRTRPTGRRSTNCMTLGELTERAWDKDVQVMIEGPGHVPDEPDRRQHDPAEAAVPWGAVLRPRSPGHRHRAGIRPHHRGHRRRDRRVERGGLPVLRHPFRAPAAAAGGGRAGGRHRHEDRRPRRRHRARDPRGDGPRQHHGRRPGAFRLEDADRDLASTRSGPANGAAATCRRRTRTPARCARTCAPSRTRGRRCTG